MANVTDFRALRHEFSPEKAHGASFARSAESSSTDAMWFYRFDANYVEARDLFSSKDHVFASLSTADIRQQFGSLLGSNAFEITNVQDAYIGESDLLVVVISVNEPQQDHILIWDPLTLHLQLLLTAPRLVTAIAVATDQATTEASTTTDELHHSRDLRLSSSTGATRQGSVRLQVNNRRKLLILGHSNGSVTVYKFKINESGHVSCTTPHAYEHSVGGGEITAIAAITAHGPGSLPTMVVGTKAGFVAILNTSGGGNVFKVDVDDLGSKKLPIQDITLVPTAESTVTLLAVSQGFIRGSSAELLHEKPCVSIYHLRLNYSDFETLGYVQPDVEEQVSLGSDSGASLQGGKTLAVTVSDDRHGLLVHCAFRVDLGNRQQQSSLKTVRVGKVGQGGMELVDATALHISEHSGNLLDISAVSNAKELHLLYLNKLESYIPNFRPAEESSSRSTIATQAGSVTGLVDSTSYAKDETAQRRRWVPESRNWIEEDITATTYTESVCAEIEERRRKMGGKLFFDRLIEFVDLSETGTLYPPHNHAQVKNLWANIYHNGQLELENRNCMAYYLLRDQATDVSEDFLQQHWISPAFVHLMNGFWALDHFQFKNAVLYLSQPGLTIDWVEEVIRVLLEQGSSALARQLILSASLEFGTRTGMSLMLQVLLRSDLEAALNYQRQQRQKAFDRHKTKRETAASAVATDDDVVLEQQQQQEEEIEDDDGFVLDPKFYEELFGQLLAYCFEGEVGNHGDKKPNKVAIHELSRLTLSRYEEQALIRYGESRPATSATRKVALEFMAMYYVKHSCFLEAVGIHQRLLEDELASGGDNSKENSERRREMIQNLKNMLPKPQTKLLELQQEERQEAAASKKMSSSDSMDVDLENSAGSLAREKDEAEEDEEGKGLRILTNTKGYRTGTMKGLLKGWVELQRDLEKLALIKARNTITDKATFSPSAATTTVTADEGLVPRKPLESLWQVDGDRYLRAWQNDLLTTPPANDQELFSSLAK